MLHFLLQPSVTCTQTILSPLLQSFTISKPDLEGKRGGNGILSLRGRKKIWYLCNTAVQSCQIIFTMSNDHWAILKRNSSEMDKDKWSFSSIICLSLCLDRLSLSTWLFQNSYSFASNGRPRQQLFLLYQVRLDSWARIYST